MSSIVTRRKAATRGKWLAAVTIAALSLAALAAWDGTQDVVLRDSFSSRFANPDGGEVHLYPFYAPTDSTLKAKLTVDKQADVVPAWRLLDANGRKVDLGDRMTSTKIKNFAFEDGGAYALEITAQSGTGRYTVNLAGSKFPRKFKRKNATGPLVFEAPEGARMTATVTGGASISGLQGPFGAVDIGAGPVTKIKNFILPHNGRYSLLYDGTAKKAQVVLKNPKKTAWELDAVAESRGQADLARSEWGTSGHADLAADAFRHWDEDGEIPTSCAACHSSFGFQDFVGADGTPSEVLGDPTNTTTNPSALGSTVDCNACHNTKTAALDVVQFPSGEIVEGLGPEAICMQCHQGRESTLSVDEAIDESGVEDDDEISASLSFQNIHYFAAGASLYGGTARGGYEYADEVYNRRFLHASTIDDCQGCHDQHSLELRLEACNACHPGTTDHEATQDIRATGSVPDYDADGDAEEGIAFELSGLAGKVYAAMQDYAEANGNPLVYASSAYPYYFNDLNGNGIADPGEINYGNRYQSFTARLLRASYNYQYWQKDPGLHAHNAKYAIEFLYDTLADMDAAASVDVPGLDEMVRNDPGHLDNTSRAFRNWDSRGGVSAGCARCHSPGGFRFYLDFGIDPTTPHPVSDGMECEQCHVEDSFTSPSPARSYVPQVTFPSGVQILNDEESPDDSFLCMTCHQGRASKQDVDDTIESGDFRFPRIHYLVAGPGLYGADAAVGYEYDENSFVGVQSYDGQWRHAGGATGRCSLCHLSDHTFAPQLTPNCTGCHPEADGNIHGVRRNRETDYNGNGDNLEFLSLELGTFAERLIGAMDDYAELVIGAEAGIVHASEFPFYFRDLNGNGVADPGEITSANGYEEYDGPLLKAAFNYEMWANEPGSWAHNTHYMLALLFDSIDDLQLAADANGTPLPIDRLTTPTLLTRPGSSD